MLPNLKKALQQHNLADFADVKITPGQFSVKIIDVVPGSQQWQVRAAEYARVFKLKDITSIINDYFDNKITDATLHLLTNVIIVDWKLTDDDGELVTYSPGEALEIFKAMPRIAAKLMMASRTASFFEQEWTQDALKN